MASCWVLTDGKAGTENQCVGLAKALGYAPSLHRIRPKFPWSILPPSLWFSPLKGVEGLEIPEEWPSLLIAGGRSAAPVAKKIRQLSGGKTFTIFIQNPYISPRHFDAVIAPQHDGLKGDNVISTQGALHRVCKASLKKAYAHNKNLLEDLSSVKAAILIGGATKHYQMDEEMMEEYGIQLRNIAKRKTMGYMVTASRRTKPSCFQALKKGLGSAPCFIWDGKGENPYLGFLAHADVIIVTADSVSMISEALSTGKPVYLLGLKGKSRRLDAFHASLLEREAIRFFRGSLEIWNNTPLQEMDEVVKKVRALGLKAPKK